MKRGTHTSSTWYGLCCILLSAGALFTAATQHYPDTLWVPVIYYDYHTDWGHDNPNDPQYIPDFDFSGGLDCGNNIEVGTPGYIHDTLDNEKKPIFKENLGCNAHIEQWYRPSGASGPSTVSEFVYVDSLEQWRWTNMRPYRGRVGEYVSEDYDSSYNFATVVIYDSLPFIHLGRDNDALRGMYQYSKLGGPGEPTFNPIPGRGFGNEIPDAPYDTVNYSFAMEIQMTFEYRPGLTFDFNGDDDVFVFIEDTLMLDLGGPHRPVDGSFNLDALGNTLGLDEGDEAHFSVFYAERNASGSNIQITTNIIARQVDRVNIEVTGDTLIAGDWKSANVELYDNDDNLIPTDSILPGGDSLYSFVSWEVISETMEPGDSINVTSGPRAQLTARRAWRDLTLVATFEEPQSGDVLRDSVTLFVKPGRAHEIVITDDNVAALYRDEASKKERAIVTDSTREDDVYAFLYDTYGNRIWDDSGKASDALWFSRDPSIASVIENVDTAYNTIEKQGQGDSTWIVAWFSRAVSDSDSVRVEAAGYTIRALRFVWCDSRDEAPDSLTMSTDGDTCLRVQGQRSDNLNWIDIQASWDVSMESLFRRVPGAQVGRWTFTPVDTGVARIITTRESATHDTIYITVTPAEPSDVSIRIINYPSDGRFVAGQEIIAEVLVQNSDSLAPLQWCYVGGGDADSGWYQDEIGYGGLDSLPVLWSEEDSALLNVRPSGALPLSQCFSQGRDTVRARLFYATGGHRLHVNLPTSTGDDTLTAHTRMFEVIPAGPHHLTPTLFDGQRFVEITDTLTLRPDSQYFFRVDAWDRFGNPLDDFRGEWKPTVISGNTDTGTIFRYKPQDSTRVCGYILISAPSNPVVNDTVFACIVPPPVEYAGTPHTRDLDANGYLDAVDIQFSRAITLSSWDMDSMLIERGAHSFSDSIVRICLSGSDSCISRDEIDSLRGTAFTIHFDEIHTTEPQSAWELFFSLQQQGVDSNRIEVADGAPPVIWKVINDVGDHSIHSDDEVRVIFSEKLGNEIKQQDKPVDYFVVTHGDNVSNVLTGEKMRFLGMQNDSIVYFRMVNDSDLTAAYYFQIKDGQVTDRNDTRTTYPNRRVQVTIVGTGFNVRVAPNPFPPQGHHIDGPLEFNAGQGPMNEHTINERIQDPNNDKYTYTVIDVLIPSAFEEQSLQLHGEIFIYDIIGNLVFHRTTDGYRSSDDIFTDVTPGSIAQTFLPWGGTNDRGMTVHPGVYRGEVIITLKYTDTEGVQQAEKQADVVRYGITR